MPDADVDAVPIVAELCAFLRAHPDAPATLAALGRRAGMSPAHLQRVFKRVAGVSPRQFAAACRLDRLKANLKEGETVTTALHAAGYGSPSRLYEAAGDSLGMTPGQYRAGGPAVVRYATAECDLGRVVLGATARGVCAVGLADTDGELVAFLAAEFPAAKLDPDPAGLGGWLADLLRHLAGKLPHLDLPLDVLATAFQRRVWEELRRIPYGQIRTYAEVAAAVGAPATVRAAARACATNPAAVVIPCHRVVGSDGKLTGYRWGIGRKRTLLDRERAGAESSGQG